MESRFGQDFGGVRVRYDAEADDAARMLNAKAYTLGQTIVFGRGRYKPATTEGGLLLAHELAHVVQQRLGSASVQRKIVDQAGDEIKIDLKGVKPGDSVTLSFPAGASAVVCADTAKIINAMVKTPSGITAVNNWVTMKSSVRLIYTDKMLKDDDRNPIHGLSDSHSTSGTTVIKVSTASLPDIVDSTGEKRPDRYKQLKGAQLLGAIGVHESVHQSPENVALEDEYNKMKNEQEDDPRLADLNKQLEIAPVRLELTSLIEYDVLYPQEAGIWLTKNFERFLGRAIYVETVKTAVAGLVSGGYLDAAKESNVRDTYLLHTKPSSK